MPEQTVPSTYEMTNFSFKPDAVKESITPDFKGNWMNLQHTRMQSPDFTEKFKAFKQRHMPGLKDGVPVSMLEKETDYKAYALKQIAQLEGTVASVHSAVSYGEAARLSPNTPMALGHGNIHKQGTVYSDAVNPNGEPLSARQKDIVAAHEAYHGVINVTGTAHKEIVDCFDWGAYDAIVDTGELQRPSYLREPDELLARMAQLKNYFGMESGELFTDVHLEYVRQHYVTDTGLDNGVSTMLTIVTPAVQPVFLTGMNTLPV